MLIRTEQIDRLRGSLVEDFRRRMILHLRIHFPHHAESLGDDGLSTVIDYGMARAHHLGFDAESVVHRAAPIASRPT
jgi:hypothetical protein